MAGVPTGSVTIAAGREASFAPAAVPLLGTEWAPYQQGYGRPHPGHIFNGGDPTGEVRSVHWRSWGEAKAIADGTGWDANGAPSVAEGRFAPAVVVAFDLGPCKGKLAYRAIEWYFPKDGESFNPHRYINMCTGDYVGS